MQTKERAKLSVHWPEIDNGIDNVLLSRKKCQDHLPSMMQWRLCIIAFKYYAIILQL